MINIKWRHICDIGRKIISYFHDYEYETTTADEYNEENLNADKDKS